MAAYQPNSRPPSVDARIAATCLRQHGVITRAQARDLGLTRAMERTRRDAGRLYEAIPGVLSLTPGLTQDGACAAALLWSRGTLAAESVLARHDLAPPPPEVHVILRAGRPAPPGVRVHKSRSVPRADIHYVRGLRATTVARALLDAAAAA